VLRLVLVQEQAAVGVDAGGLRVAEVRTPGLRG
jgi:hypothetical protein